MMICKEATRLMSEGQERKLTTSEKAALSVHTMICSGCRNFSQHMKVLRTMARHFSKAADNNDDGK